MVSFDHTLLGKPGVSVGKERGTLCPLFRNTVWAPSEIAGVQVPAGRVISHWCTPSIHRASLLVAGVQPSATMLFSPHTGTDP